MLKEEAMAIKEQLKSSDFDNFRASDGWLDRWKTTYSVKERRVVGEAGDVSTETVTSWMERINELIESYSLENIWNMDESGCFFKALLDKGLIEKGKQTKSGKKSKQRLTVTFFVNAAGERVDQPIVIWKSKLPRCLKKLKDPSCPVNIHYFSNPKSWMTSEVMEAVLARFNRKLVLEDRKFILFLDNATCHPEYMIRQFSQIKIVFLPKNTTSTLQPLDAGITQNFKVVWIQEVWKEVSNSTIKNCFEKCGIKGNNELMEVQKDDDLEFEAPVKEFTTEISAVEYVNFDANVSASEPMINEFEIYWRQRVRDDSIKAIQNREISNDQVEKISDDGEGNDENDELEQEVMSFKELITVLDKMRRCPVFDDETQDMLSTITRKIENLQLKNRKQSSIKEYFANLS